MSFPAKKNGCIETMELQTLPTGPLYAVQEKAWMDGDEMKEWVDGGGGDKDSGFGH